jgi:hypothetical protein
VGGLFNGLSRDVGQFIACKCSASAVNKADLSPGHCRYRRRYYQGCSASAAT